MPRVIVVGYICLDLIPSFPPNRHVDLRVALAPGEVVEVDNIEIGTGGAVSNTGIALAKLGIQVSYSALVGEDEIGRLIHERLSAWGDMRGLISRNDGSSPYTIVLAPPSFDRAFLFHPGSNSNFSEEHIDWGLVQEAQHLHFGYPNIMRALSSDDGQKLASIFQKAKSLGLSTSLDLALPGPNSAQPAKDWRSWLGAVLPHVDLFAPSIEETLKLWDPETYSKYANTDNFVDSIPIETYRRLGADLQSAGCAVVVLKAGDRGMYVRTGAAQRLRQIAHLQSLSSSPEEEYWGCSFLQETVASAVGAGDAAIAGLIGALLRGKTMTEAVTFGNCVGWQNLRGRDAVAGIGDWEETCDLVRTLPINKSAADDTWSPTDVRGVYRLAGA